MSLSQEQLKALDDLPAPDSLDRIIRFLSDLGSQGNVPLGETGRSAQTFAASLASDSAQSFSARQTSGWVAILMDRYQIKIGEIQEFALWFVQRQEIFSETEDRVEMAPDMTLARPPLSAPSPDAPAPSPGILDAPPSTTMRRLSVSSEDEFPETDQEPAPPAAPEERPSRRQITGRTLRPGGSAPRLRRIERGSISPESEDVAEGEQSEESMPTRSPFRLTPSMVMRPAFVADVGLAGMLGGLALGSPTASAMETPAMPLVSSAFPSIGQTPGTGSPFGMGSLPTYSNAVPTVAPPFTPMVSPSSPSPVWLGMPPDAPDLTPPSATASPAMQFNSAMPNSSAMPLAPRPDGAPQALDGTPQAWESLPGVPAETLVGASPLMQTGALPLAPTSLPLAGLAAGSAALSMAQGLLPDKASPQTFATQAFTPQALFLGGRPADNGSSAGPLTADIFATPAPPPLLAATPEMGQLTLMAPPLQVASPQAQSSGIAASMDWQTLVGGAGPLDEGGLARLKQALPEQASVLYPALPTGSLSAGAVNLPLAAPLVQSLLQKGYQNAGLGVSGSGASGTSLAAQATQAANLATAAGSGKPPAAPLSAQLVPAKRPAGAAPGVMGHPAETQGGAGALGEAGKGQATRGGVMDFLGLPIRLAPSLSGQSTLKQETAARTPVPGPSQTPTALRPEQFAPLRNRLFPTFQSMTVEPDKAAWQKAAPAFGLRDGKPTTLLAPDARIPVQTPTAPQPPSRGRPSLASPTARAPGGPLSLSPLSLSPLPPSPLSPARLLTGQPRSAVPTPLAALGHTAIAPTPTALGGAAFPGSSLLPTQTLGAQPLGARPIGLRQGTAAVPGFAPHAGPSASFPSVMHTPGLAPAASQPPASILGSHGLGPNIGSSRLTSPVPPSLTHSPLTHSPLTHSPLTLPSTSRYSQTHSSPAPTQSTSTLSLGPGKSFEVGAQTSRHSQPHSFATQSPSRLTSARVPAGGTQTQFVPGRHSPARPGGLSQASAKNISPLGTRGPNGALISPASRFSPAANFSTAAQSPGAAFRGGNAQPLAPRLPKVQTAYQGLPAPALAFPRLAAAAVPRQVPQSRFTSLTPQTLPPAALPPKTFGTFSPRSGNPSGGFHSAPPAMRLAPSPSRRPAAETAAMKPLSIQRAERSTTVSAAQNQNQNSGPHTQAVSGPDSAAAGEVAALASEVWSLLKRRLATEAERRGRW